MSLLLLLGTTVVDMEIQSNDRGRLPQRVQNVECSAQVSRGHDKISKLL